MFQNLSSKTEDETREINNDNERNNNKSDFLKRTFSIQNCVIYVLSFMMSMASGNSNLLTSPVSLLQHTPFL